MTIASVPYYKAASTIYREKRIVKAFKGSKVYLLEPAMTLNLGHRFRKCMKKNSDSKDSRNNRNDNKRITA